MAFWTLLSLFGLVSAGRLNGLSERVKRGGKGENDPSEGKGGNGPSEPGDEGDEVDQTSCPFGGVSNDKDFYDSKAAAFIGMNPIIGDGSGFFYDTAQARDVSWGIAKDTKSGRNHMCTCDCKGSADGIHCAGYAGISFRYVSHLAAAGKDGKCAEKEWYGQMVGEQCAGKSVCKYGSNFSGNFWHWQGENRREYPGGSVSYRVSGVPSGKDGEKASLLGVFRQLNGPVSCVEAIRDADEAIVNATTSPVGCYTRCPADSQYRSWLAWCRSKTEDSLLGYSGKAH